MGKGLTRCNRCGGMMVQEKIYYETEHFWAWKCVYCGDYIDQVILENRQIQKSSDGKSVKDHKDRVYGPYSDTPST
ncbi:MAG TPA: hypothetical protein VMV04_19740 [Thermodesulfobacteriota bacterium]|nr:hypothetical protein [Thermodesulfobacteriota bacterium]HVP80119.1 hypothetical protein [Thermodesulfobacteriota bacterium]